MNLANKNIVLTGASSGIGADLLKSLATYPNVKIVAVARNINTIPSYEGIVFPFSADLSAKEGIDSLFDYARSVLDGIDIFIANAGFGYCERIDRADWSHIDHIYKLNVFSPIYSLEKLIELGGSSKVFVPVISGAALLSLPYYSIYGSTKAALHSFVETYRFESKLKVMSVYPVATRTSFFDKAANKSNASIPLFSQEVGVVTRAIIKGLENDKKRVYPSFIFRIFYPIARAFPFLFTLYSKLERKRTKL